MLVGPPVDLSKYQGQPIRGTVLREATADIMAAITRQLEELRGEKAPDTPYDMNRATNRAAARPEQGASDRSTDGGTAEAARDTARDADDVAKA